MSELRAAVYVAPPIPFHAAPHSKGVLWSPISCTLIYSAEEAVLVDTPITIKQIFCLLEWIENIAPKQKLAYIYVTHGHGDHFFGIPIILNRFPEAIPVAIPGVIERMKQQVQEPIFSTVWANRFPDQFPFRNRWCWPIHCRKAIDLPFKTAGPSRLSNAGTLIPAALQSCGFPASSLPCVVMLSTDKVHQMLFEANTNTKREEWIRAIEKVEALGPAYVVPGHKQAGEIDGVWHLAATKKYMEEFGDVVTSEPKDPGEVFARMVELPG